jgi:hypothetical protein
VKIANMGVVGKTPKQNVIGHDMDHFDHIRIPASISSIVPYDDVTYYKDKLAHEGDPDVQYKISRQFKLFVDVFVIYKI